MPQDKSGIASATSKEAQIGSSDPAWVNVTQKESHVTQALLNVVQAQRRAADPDVNVWVEASAGSGKTKVLTDRLLRLLLPRADGTAGTACGREWNTWNTWNTCFHL